MYKTKKWLKSCPLLRQRSTLKAQQTKLVTKLQTAGQVNLLKTKAVNWANRTDLSVQSLSQKHKINNYRRMSMTYQNSSTLMMFMKTNVRHSYIQIWIVYRVLEERQFLVTLLRLLQKVLNQSLMMNVMQAQFTRNVRLGSLAATSTLCMVKLSQR